MRRSRRSTCAACRNRSISSWRRCGSARGRTDSSGFSGWCFPRWGWRGRAGGSAELVALREESALREWLRETHGGGFELFRQFLLRFFDGDMVTAPGQTTTALISAFSVLLPWFPMIVGPLRAKYAYFSGL